MTSSEAPSDYSPEPPPQAEFRADYGGIRLIARIAIVLAVLAALYALFNMSGIGTRSSGSPGYVPPAISTPTMNENYGTAEYVPPINALVHDIWKWGWFFAIISLLSCIGHFLRASGATRMLLRALLVGWVIWTIAGVTLSWELPSSSGETFGNLRGGVVSEMLPESASPSTSTGNLGVLGILVMGLLVGGLLSLIAALPDYESTEARIASGRLSSGFTRKQDQVRSEFDIGGFHVGACIGGVLFTFLPAILDGIFGAEGLVYAITMWITFPAWFIISPFSHEVSEASLALFLVWAAIALALCLWQLRYPSRGKGMMLLFNHMIAVLFVWASLPHVASAGTYLHAGQVFGFSTLIALFGGLLICIPLREFRLDLSVADSGVSDEWMAGSVTSSSSIFCGKCGAPRQTHEGPCESCGWAMPTKSIALAHETGYCEHCGKLSPSRDGQCVSCGSAVQSS